MVNLLIHVYEAGAIPFNIHIPTIYGLVFLKQVEKESKSVGLEKEDALNQVRWRVGVGEIAVRVGKIQPPPSMGINPNQNWFDNDRIWLLQEFLRGYFVLFIF